MRYAIVILDGAADTPRPELGGKTPLMEASMPALTELTRTGRLFRAQTVPAGFAPGSDVACLSVFGYNPADVYTGRAPLEAAAMGLTLKPGQAVYRANTVTIEHGMMKDYSAGHITTPESHELVTYIAERLDMPGVSLHPGVQYRHACIIDGAAGRVGDTTPPHDILDQSAEAHLPRNGVADQLRAIMERTRTLCADAPVNAARRAAGKRPATQLWLWGGGVMPKLKTYRELFGIHGAVISAVDLIRGIGRLAGLDLIDVPGATGFYDTNYDGKGSAALKSLASRELVFVHIEAPDEAGHNGHTDKKVWSLEQIDKYILAPLLAEAKRAGDIRILAMPDHPTPIAIRTHTPDPVPACIWGPGISAGEAHAFTEEEARANADPIIGSNLMKLLTAR